MQPIRLRPWYDHEAVRVVHEAECSRRREQEEQENNEGSAPESPNPQDSTTENENGITEKDNASE